METIAVDGIALSFETESGIIDRLTIGAASAGGTQPLRPLHRAPWVESGETLPDFVAPIEARLAGDFFCAPFGPASAEVAIHGWAANGSWEPAGTDVAGDGALTASFHLRQAIQGARLVKEITLCPGHPIVYQRHALSGGNVLLPVAHHAMLHVPGGAALSFSAKLHGATPGQGLETDPARGRSILSYPQRFDALSSVKRADGTTVDASVYPFAESHEDLIILTEKPGARLGWSAAVAVKEGFVFFAVKDAAALPQTVLWMSNGGRDYPPWNGRHRAVIGIEEASIGDPLSDAASGAQGGIRLEPDRTTSIAYAFGAIAVPSCWTGIVDIAVKGDRLVLTDASGATRDLPFLGAHFDAPR